MTGYPIILGGDHAAFEAEWATSGRPDNERPDWPLPSFDAQDWAAAFCKIATNLGYKDADGKPIDEGWMISWFANSLMRGFDENASRLKPAGWRWRHNHSSPWTHGEEEPTGPSIHLFTVERLFKRDA